MRLIATQRTLVISGLLLFINYGIYAHPNSVTDCIEYAHRALLTNGGHIHAVFFVPDDITEVKTVLLGLIYNEKESINGAHFRLTDKDIADALIDAKRRRVKVRLVIDNGGFLDPYEKLSLLINKGVLVHRYVNGTTLMHNKIWIFGKNFGNQSFAVNGSANATRSGLTRNEENLMITNDKRIVARYQTKLEQLCKKTQLFNTRPPRNFIEKFTDRPQTKIKRHIKMQRLIY